MLPFASEPARKGFMRDYAIRADVKGALRLWCSVGFASFLVTMAIPRLSAQEITVYVSSKAGDRLALKPALRFGPSGRPTSLSFESLPGKGTRRSWDSGPRSWRRA